MAVSNFVFERESPTRQELLMKKPNPRRPLAFVLIALIALSGVVVIPLAQAFEIKIRNDASGNIVLDWDSQAGARYEVLWNPNLSRRASEWQVMSEIIAASANSTAMDSGDVGRPHPLQSQSRFYIIRESAAPSDEPTVISDHVGYSTTWTRERSPYLLTNEIRIITGATLTIPAGVEVRATASGALKVEGALQLLGTQVEPVVFTAPTRCRNPATGWASSSPTRVWTARVSCRMRSFSTPSAASVASRPRPPSCRPGSNAAASMAFTWKPHPRSSRETPSSTTRRMEFIATTRARPWLCSTGFAATGRRALN